MRRRQRRLRSWLRHERMTVAMTLAEFSHRPKGTKDGREWSTSSTTAYGHRSLHSRRCGRAVSLTPGRNGVTAPCGAPHG